MKVLRRGDTFDVIIMSVFIKCVTRTIERHQRTKIQPGDSKQQKEKLTKYYRKKIDTKI